MFFAFAPKRATFSSLRTAIWSFRNDFFSCSFSALQFEELPREQFGRSSLCNHSDHRFPNLEFSSISKTPEGERLVETTKVGLMPLVFDEGCLPAPIQAAFKDRGLLPLAELAVLLGIDRKTLREHVKAGNIRYIAIGSGVERVRKVFAPADVAEFLALRSRLECPSSKPKNLHTINTASTFQAFDFTALREKQTSAAQKQLKSVPKRLLRKMRTKLATE